MISKLCKNICDFTKKKRACKKNTPRTKFYSLRGINLHPGVNTKSVVFWTKPSFPKFSPIWSYRKLNSILHHVVFLFLDITYIRRKFRSLTSDLLRAVWRMHARARCWESRGTLSFSDSGGSSRLAKAAGAEPSGEMIGRKVVNCVVF